MAAGRIFALKFVGNYTIQAADGLVVRHPNISLDVYLDNRGLDAVGSHIPSRGTWSVRRESSRGSWLQQSWLAKCRVQKGPWGGPRHVPPTAARNPAPS